jgi:calcium-dependent protein kinase
MTNCKWCRSYDIDWTDIITSTDANGDGEIDFQEFMSACVDRKCLVNKEEVKQAFSILDTNKDGTLTIDDFNDVFNSYCGAKMDKHLWNDLLAEADTNGDGVISFEEF